MRTKTNELVTLLDITPEQYAVRADEQHLYHCRIELEQFDPKSGKRLSNPSLQKFNAKEVGGGMLSRLAKQGYTVDVLYSPEELNRKLMADKDTAAKAPASKAQSARK